MGLIHRPPAPGGVRGLAVAWSAALVLVLVAVGPSLGAAPSPIRLSQPSVSDRSSAAGEPVTFRIEYRHRGGLDPVSVVVRVGPVSYAMAPAGADGNVRKGVIYMAVASPPAGKLDVHYVAVDPEGAVGELDDGWMTVTPPPAPAPTPGDSGSGGGTTKPPPPATPAPPPPAVFSPPDAGGGSAIDAPAPPQPEPTNAPTALVGPTLEAPTPPADRFGESRDPGLAPGGSVGAIDPGWWMPPSAATAGDPRPIPTRRVPGPAVAPGRGALPGLPPDLLVADPFTSVVISTIGGAAMVTAFLLFGRRRDDDEDDPSGGRSAAASADAALASGAMAVAAWPGQGPAAPGTDPEALIPRWRRPSLLQARKHDPARAPEPEPAPRLTFDSAAVPLDDDLERRRIRYRVVRLLDSPDEFTAREIGLLDEGDEVALCESSGSYWLVLCPDGNRGWVHRMVLGSAVDVEGDQDVRSDRRSDEELLEPGLAARLTAARPMPTWTYRQPTTDAAAGNLDDERIDDDVIAAYRAARARA